MLVLCSLPLLMGMGGGSTAGGILVSFGLGLGPFVWVEDLLSPLVMVMGGHWRVLMVVTLPGWMDPYPYCCVVLKLGVDGGRSGSGCFFTARPLSTGGGGGGGAGAYAVVLTPLPCPVGSGSGGGTGYCGVLVLCSLCLPLWPTEMVVVVVVEGMEQ